MTVKLNEIGKFVKLMFYNNKISTDFLTYFKFALKIIK